MILVDANVLIYAVNADSAHHQPSRSWLETALSGTDLIGFPWIVVLAFLRITTRHGIMQKPLSPDAALAYVDSWLRQPCALLVGPGENHWPILRGLLRTSGLAGNLTSDAHVAALALETGSSICTTDHDFRRFAGVTVISPNAS